ncbi:MAG: alpha/beta hydrolase [Gammaproteobacteria bacterium]|nr:alpha/beta hydrolase [Gammaproteobacteria bacterium]
MTISSPFIRSVGEGENVVCLHSSLGSSKQWSDLMERLRHRYRVSATDLFGYGKSPCWDAGRPFSLDDEVDLLAPVLDSLSGPIHLVGHSYGGAVALRTAQRYGDRIRSLCVYEPVAFSLLFAESRSRRASREIRRIVDIVGQDYRAGRHSQATGKFIDYWSGPGAWSQFSGQQQQSLSARIGTVLANFEALASNRGNLTRLCDTNVPTLCLHGMESPRPGVEIAAILGRELPRVSVKPLAGMGHMGPITHAGPVNLLIESFLRDRQSDYAGQAVPLAARTRACRLAA